MPEPNNDTSINDCKFLIDVFRDNLIALKDHVRLLELKRVREQSDNRANFEIPEYDFLKTDLLLMFDSFVLDYIDIVFYRGSSNYTKFKAAEQTETARDESKITLPIDCERVFDNLENSVYNFIYRIRDIESKGVRNRSDDMDYKTFFHRILDYNSLKKDLLLLFDKFVMNYFYAHETIEYKLSPFWPRTYRPIGSIATKLTPTSKLYEIAKRLTTDITRDQLADILYEKDGHEYAIYIDEKRTRLYRGEKLHVGGDFYPDNENIIQIHSHPNYAKELFYNQLLDDPETEGHDNISAGFNCSTPSHVDIYSLIGATLYYSVTNYTPVTQYILSPDRLLSYVIHPLLYKTLQNSGAQRDEMIASIVHNYALTCKQVALESKRMGLHTVSQYIDYFERKVNQECLITDSGKGVGIPIFSLNYIDTRGNIV